MRAWATQDHRIIPLAQYGRDEVRRGAVTVLPGMAWAVHRAIPTFAARVQYPCYGGADRRPAKFVSASAAITAPALPAPFGVTEYPRRRRVSWARKLEGRCRSGVSGRARLSILTRRGRSGGGARSFCESLRDFG